MISEEEVWKWEAAIEDERRGGKLGSGCFGW